MDTLFLKSEADIIFKDLFTEFSLVSSIKTGDKIDLHFTYRQFEIPRSGIMVFTEGSFNPFLSSPNSSIEPNGIPWIKYFHLENRQEFTALKNLIKSRV
jgi:hypothetical protein